MLPLGFVIFLKRGSGFCPTTFLGLSSSSGMGGFSHVGFNYNLFFYSMGKNYFWRIKLLGWYVDLLSVSQ